MRKRADIIRPLLRRYAYAAYDSVIMKLQPSSISIELFCLIYVQLHKANKRQTRASPPPHALG